MWGRVTMTPSRHMVLVVVRLVLCPPIVEQRSHKDVGQVGIHFMKFCGKYELVKISEQAEQYSRWLNETYSGVLND